MIRVGVLGASAIAPSAMIAPARRRADVVVAAVASRRPEAAQEFAQTHSISTVHTSYEDLCADDSIDLVYNALPPSEHAHWSMAALEQGRHVLCEKPSAMDASEARTMVDAARRADRRLLEAFHYRHHPLMTHVLDVVQSGQLGIVTTVDATFTATIRYDPRSIRHDPAVGGGALMDLGCYSAHMMRSIVGEEPEVARASGTPNALGSDVSIEAHLQFPSGIRGRLHASMTGTTSRQSLVVTGERGSLEVRGIVLPHNGHQVRLDIDGTTNQYTVAGRMSYDHQLDAVVGGLASGERLATEGADIIANMELLDAIYRAASWSRPGDAPESGEVRS